MKKMIAAAVTAVFAASMVSTVFADDVSVRTSIGSGEVVFTETSEAADISAEDLTALVKDAITTLEENEALNGFLDVEASISLGLGEQEAMSIAASVIGSTNKNGEDGYASLFFSLSGLGDPQSGKYEAYHWVKDDTHYTAESDGNGWTVKEENILAHIFDQIESSMETEEVGKISLDALLPNLYEENGNKYYVCVYDRDTFMNTLSGVPGVELYTAMADGILGDNDLKLIVVVNAETGLLRAFSLDASGAAGQIPGDLFGAEGTAFDYSAEDLYATILMDTDAQEIEIPEEVLNTPVEESGSDLDLGSVLSGLGLGGEAE